MQPKAVASGLAKFASTLVATIVFPVVWLRMIAVARRHTDLAPRGPQKAAVAAVAGLLLAGLGVFMVLDFQAGATEGTYATLDGRMSSSLGNEQYNEHVALAEAAQGRIDLANQKLADGEDRETWERNRDLATADRDREQAAAAALEGNHILYETVSEFIAAQDDEGALTTIANRGAVDFPGLDANVESAFAKKDATISAMQNFLIWFVWPGIAGVLFAPLIFAMGQVLSASFVPSDGVGFKQYPAGAMALFLLFGGFGVPALFFAAWTFQDIQSRSETGQITL